MPTTYGWPDSDFERDKQAVDNTACKRLGVDQLIDLLDVIGHDKADLPDYCSSSRYWSWEISVAIPALKEKGYSIHAINFITLEGDSCGPLSRGIRVEKDGVKSMAWYG